MWTLDRGLRRWATISRKETGLCKHFAKLITGFMSIGPGW